MEPKNKSRAHGKNGFRLEQLRGRRQVNIAHVSRIVSSLKSFKGQYLNARNRENLPGKVIRAEGGNLQGGKACTEAYNYSGYTINFMTRSLERNSN